MDYSSSSANSSANRSGATGEALSLRPGALRVAAKPPSGAEIFAEHLARVAKDRARADDAHAMTPGQRREHDTARARREEAEENRAQQASHKKDSDRTDKPAGPGDPEAGPRDASAPADGGVADTRADTADATQSDGDGDKAASAEQTETQSRDNAQKAEDENGKQDDSAAQAAAVETKAPLEKTKATKGDTAEKAVAGDGKAAAPLTPEEKKAALQAAGKAGSADATPQKGDTAGDKAASAPADDKTADSKPADKTAAQPLANAETQANAKSAAGDSGDEPAVSAKDKKGLGHEAAQKLADAKSDATKGDAARNQPTANAAAPGQAGPDHAKAAASAKGQPAAAAPQPAQGTPSNGAPANNDLVTGVPAQAARGNGSSPTMRIGTLPGQTQPTQLPASALAIQMARNLNKGVDRFEIRLDPPEMGRIDVKMEVHKDGHVSAHMMADKQDTLDLLQRDQRALQQALQNAGLDTDNSSLSFSLRDQNPDSGGAFADNNGNGGTAGGIDDDADAADLAQASVYNVNIAANGGVDIRI
ncbi:flagellar hook-length control protein FliK [Parvibaculum indicum]|uniref:flagellar hook-length control protein FliK n=1 Tax=Parvibaculum indicum TaxID=562969 RepID=UPI0014210AB7|nr:flagellar hook-length control protein FliK [Parvibaculum indicum]NIJ40411.1 flagellar hook-length control protein FliK [Parvibaculum indicum]